MVNFNKIYHFSRFQRGPTFSRGGGGSNCLFPIETCDFPGGSGTPVPPSGSALALHARTYLTLTTLVAKACKYCLYFEIVSRRLDLHFSSCKSHAILGW